MYIVIWVIVNKLTKLTHFLLGKAMYTVDTWTQLYMREIVKLRKVPVSIVSDWDHALYRLSDAALRKRWVLTFISAFRRGLKKAPGTHFNSSTTFHPQTDDETE